MSRWTKRLVTLAWLTLALTCGYVSYCTQVELFTHVCHEGFWSSHLMPLASDALMILAAVKILERKGHHWRKRVFPALVMYAGLGVSVWANLATAEAGNYASMFARGWIAVALWMAVEMLVRPTAKLPTKALSKAPVVEPEKVAKPRSVSVSELRAKAAVAGVKGRSKMGREQLELALGMV